VNLEYGPKYEEFRATIRAFLEQHKNSKPAQSLMEVSAQDRASWLSLLMTCGARSRSILHRSFRD